MNPPDGVTVIVVEPESPLPDVVPLVDPIVRVIVPVDPLNVPSPE